MKSYVHEVYRKQKPKDDESEEEEEPEDRQAASVLYIYAENNDNSQTRRVQIRWNQALRPKLNFRLPYNDFEVTVIAARKQIACFTKLRLDEEWGPLEALF